MYVVYLQKQEPHGIWPGGVCTACCVVVCIVVCRTIVKDCVTHNVYSCILICTK